MNSLTIDNGNKISFKKTGNGSKNVIIIPGGPGLTLDYLNIFHKELGNDFTVYSYNPSGTFGSTEEPYGTIEEYGQELNALIKTLGLIEYSLIGHSIGSGIALEASFLEKKHLSNLILVNSFPSGISLKNSISNRFNSLPEEVIDKKNKAVKDGDSETFSSIIMEYWVPKYFTCGKEMHPDLITSLTNLSKTKTNLQFIGPDLFNASGNILKWDPTQKIRKSDFPVHIMQGKNDYMNENESIDFKNMFKNAELWIGENSAHLCMYNETEAFFKALRRLL